MQHTTFAHPNLNPNTQFECKTTNPYAHGYTLRIEDESGELVVFLSADQRAALVAALLTDEETRKYAMGVRAFNAAREADRALDVPIEEANV